MDGQSLLNLPPHDWLWMVSPSSTCILLTGYGWSVHAHLEWLPMVIPSASLIFLTGYG